MSIWMQLIRRWFGPSTEVDPSSTSATIALACPRCGQACTTKPSPADARRLVANCSSCQLTWVKSPPTLQAHTPAETQFLKLDSEAQRDILKGYFRVQGQRWLAANPARVGNVLCDSCGRPLQSSEIFFNKSGRRAQCPTCMDRSLLWWSEDRTDLNHFGQGVIAEAIELDKRFSAG